MEKIIQITAGKDGVLWALCKDGTVWYLEGGCWYQLKAKPWTGAR